MDVNAFVSDRNVRLTWIAFFTQWVLWGLVYFVRHAFGHESEGPAPAADPEQEGKKKWRPDGAVGVSLEAIAFYMMNDLYIFLVSSFPCSSCIDGKHAVAPKCPGS